MAEKNLHDIKIDDLESSKKTPLKNILTLLALLFIILVISVVITKLILNDEDSEIDNNVTTSGITTPAITEGDSNSNSALATGALVAGATGAAVVAATTTSTATTPTSAITAPNITNVLKERNASSSKTKVTLRDHQPVSTTKKVVEKKVTRVTPKKVVPKKVVVKKVTPKKVVVKKETPKKSIGSYNPTPGYYIKVGTFKDISNAVKKVEKTTLNYKLIKTKNDKTMTRVLIGPFSSEDAAKSHLKNVQTNITEGAYITKVN